jgi:uncharacterized protein with von Willebrand factor type A (vWA) domain
MSACCVPRAAFFMTSLPPGLAPRLVSFCEELRREGVAIGTSEILDAFAALESVPWTREDDFREALAATVAKSQEDRRVFELLFERFFFRAAESEALERGIAEDRRSGEGDRLDLGELRAVVRKRTGVETGALVASVGLARFGPPSVSPRAAREAKSELRVVRRRLRRAIPLARRTRGLFSIRSLIPSS